MAVFQATLNQSRLTGYMIGFGAILAEAIYCGIPLFGVSSMREDHPLLDILFICFIPIMFFLGIYSIIHRKKGIEMDTQIPNQVKPIIKTQNKSKKGLFGNFIYGFLLCASNPMTFIFWIQATIALQQQQLINKEPLILTAFFIGVPIGTFLLYTVFAQIAHITRKRINPTIKIRINLAIGIIFIVLAAYLLISFLDKKDIIDLGIF